MNDTKENPNPSTCEELPKLNARLTETVVALAKNDMNACRAAKELYTHRNTIDYHIMKIKYITGLDPKKFFDLVELLRRYAGWTP